ncbi:MAG: GEVED domain-containing protein, partial [Flavobacteriales bacterium]
GSGTSIVVSNDTIPLTGLTAFTTYQYYVTSLCTASDSSPWAGPYTFTTLCNDTNVGPWSDGVEGHPNTTTGSAIANCWTSTNTGSVFDWNITSGGTPSSGTGALSANTGSKFFYTEASGAGTSDTAILNTPSIDLSSLTTPFLEFYYHMFGNQIGSLSAQVFNGTTWTNEITITGSQQASQASSWNQQYVDLSSYSGVIKIRFIAISNGSYEGDICLDDIAVVESPACFSPTMAGVTVNTSTSATPSWSAPLFGTPTSYIVRYDTAGFNPLVTGTNVVSSTLSTTLTGLTAKTNYDYYVRTYCGGTDSSVWVGPISFYTWYCVPAPSSVDASGITNVTIGTINNTTGSEPGRYGDYDSLSTDIIQGAPAQAFSIQYSTGYTYGTKIWIDWNDNLVFDINEQVYFGLSASTNPTVLSGTFAVPASAPLGSHIMRIGGTDNNAGPSSPCYTGSYGSFEDYTVNVIPPCYVAATDSFVVCDSMMWRNGITYSSSNNTAIDTLKSSIAGICDTIFMLNLTVKNSTTYTDSYVVCDSMTWIDGNTYTVSNNSATHIIPNSVGCDSIITLDLTVNNSKTFTNIVTACESYTLPGGRTMNYTGSFTDTIPTTLGCDSVITTLLTINYNAYKTISVTSCGSYTSPSGKIWATSGTRYDTIPTSLGCDSLLTINLTVKANTAETRTISSCGSYTVPETGNTYPVSGTYTDFVTNAFGCIKTITTILTVNSVVASAPTVSGITLTSPNTGVSYKWMDCENAYSYILGETSQAYTPERNGEYAVEITSVDGCKDTSSCTEIRSVSLDEYVVNASDVNVYPNPSNDRVTIDITKLNENENVTIQLFDAIGKVIYSTVISAKNNSVELETSSLPQGVYSISISNEYFSISKKLTVIH